MSKLLVTGGKKLEGELEIYSAKNAVLPLLAATIIPKTPSVIKNCPRISDVSSMLEILKSIGCKISFEGKDVKVDPSDADGFEISEALAGKMRSSVFLVGALLSRFSKAKIAYPGGCDIGLRPINLHLDGLRALGVKIKEEGGYIICDGGNMHANDITLDFPSVGATENLIMASCLQKGVTTIKNAATEPEISDLVAFINSVGGRISGGGTGKLVIEGVKSLDGASFSPLPDRIVAGTYLVAAAMTGGEVTLKNVNDGHISAIISKLKESACKIYPNNDKITITSSGCPIAIKNIRTSPYPGFPTDLQAQMMALNAIASGVSVIEENMFETRFRHVSELVKMGADIIVSGKTAIINGVKKLNGASVKCFDLRGGAAMVLAAIKADGTSTISDVHHIDRGYECVEEELRQLGADIRRIE